MTKQEAMEKVCAAVQKIMAEYREQCAGAGGVDTPGGLEHMGDVWRLFRSWDAMLAAAEVTP